jgi:hypothetical protein
VRSREVLTISSTQEIARLLAAMMLVSEAPSGKPLDSDTISGGQEHSPAPPGAWSDERAIADVWSSVLNRIAEVMRVELDRRQGRSPRGSLNEMDQNARILGLWAGRPSRWIAWVEDLPEADVEKIRRRGREVLS